MPGSARGLLLGQRLSTLFTKTPVSLVFPQKSYRENNNLWNGTCNAPTLWIYWQGDDAATKLTEVGHDE